MPGKKEKEDYRLRPELTTDGGRTHTVLLTNAFRIVRFFGDREPTVPLLMSHFGMSRATAYRWLAAYRAANPR